MLFALILSHLSMLVASQQNCAVGVIISNGETTIGTYSTTFSLGAGQSVCLHTEFPDKNYFSNFWIDKK